MLPKILKFRVRKKERSPQRTSFELLILSTEGLTVFSKLQHSRKSIIPWSVGRVRILLSPGGSHGLRNTPGKDNYMLLVLLYLQDLVVKWISEKKQKQISNSQSSINHNHYVIVIPSLYSSH
jgi:hypothetical protein